VSDLQDPMMKEIIDDFCDESQELFDQLEECLEVLEEDSTQVQQLEKFGQIIDRVMGAAKSIGAEQTALFCEMGKIIGYKSSQIEDPPLIEIVVAILFDSVELLRKMVNSLKENKKEDLQSINTKAFATRLQWLADKFKSIKRSSIAIGDNEQEKSIDSYIKELGL